jgi:hypothetical protein
MGFDSVWKTRQNIGEKRLKVTALSRAERRMFKVQIKPVRAAEAAPLAPRAAAARALIVRPPPARF